ncbi:MAG: ATP-dependent Clp protease proteolytic subunit [Alphaproteobacteria bacterium]|nr:ATP-dependent Clp protease proteolytic subunit [Alphaproteobacteria bacterium]
MIIPTVLEKTTEGTYAYDIYSRLLNDRIIFLGEQINDHSANVVIAQLLFLNAQDQKKDIRLYVNSPGGSVTATWAIVDTMNHINADVSTVCVGMAASGGAVVLSAGKKGKRFVLPNAEVMIHQPLGGTEGQATDIAISAKHILQTKNRINKFLSETTGQSLKKIETDTERDFFMLAHEAVEYGIVDKVIKKI